jgi:putative radical SAM enzyme (TIGR03279 family)
MSTARVVAVAPGSPAAAAGLLPGDELLTLNGEMVRDVIRYQIQADEPRLELEVRRGGLEHLVTIDKAAGAPLGLDLASAVFDRVRTCDNHCPFCFIYQLPPNMRKSLSLKDDDYRLSFLYGNFTTLTRFTEADLERVVTEQLSPLYVSIHATDPDLRARLLRNRRGATSLRWLAALLDAGIEVHGQVVVCPGLNDGDALDDTLLGVFDRFPALASIGVVPLGVSDHTTEPEMRPHTRAEAERVLDVVGEWQARYLATLGRRLVYASDEYHLLAGRPFPGLDAYDDLPQHENGIGMAAQFAAEVRAELAGDDIDVVGTRSGFFAWVEGAPAEGYRAPRLGVSSFETPVELPVTLSLRWNDSANDSSRRAGDSAGDSANDSWRRAGDSVGDSSRRAGDSADDSFQRNSDVCILTGEYGARILEPLADALAAATGATVDVRPVPNRFFGGNIAVTGLLTGADIARALDGVASDTRVLLPDVVLSNGRFLDDTTVADLPRPVEVVATDGASLVKALRA